MRDPDGSSAEAGRALRWYARSEILFEPQTFEETPEPLFMRLLESRDLLAKQAVEYEVTFPTRPEDPYILFVPKYKEHADRDSWMIRPDEAVISAAISEPVES